MVFSTNQVRHLYVAKELKEGETHVLASDNEGSIALKKDNNKSHMYFEYKGAGGLTRSDLIDTDKVLYAKATSASELSRKLKKVTVTLDPDVNKGNLVIGQEYILRIVFRQYLGMSDEDQYQKYGMVHVHAGMDASKFYKVLAISLAKNFSREVTPLLKFKIGNTEVTPYTKLEDLVDEADSLVIEEVEQPWTLGIQEQVPVYFTVYSSTITVDSDEVTWGKVVEGDSDTVIENGHTIADLEYFCMGERGDQYRGIGFPNTIPTKYMVDPSKPYHVLDIHYAYSGSNECVQKSEKDITIVSANKAVINGLVAALNAATGMEVASLA